MFFLSIIFKQACYSAFDLRYLWTCSPKILMLGNRNKRKKIFFSLYFRGLNYLWTYSPKILSFGKAKEKMLFLLLFAHLIVSLHGKWLDTAS